MLHQPEASDRREAQGLNRLRLGHIDPTDDAAIGHVQTSANMTLDDFLSVRTTSTMGA